MKPMILAGFGIIAAALVVLFFIFDLQHYFSLPFIQSSGQTLRAWIMAHHPLGEVIFAFSFLLIILFCLPYAALMTLTAGFLFGFKTGVFLVFVSATLGAALLFWIASTSFGDVLRRRGQGLYTKYAPAIQKDAVYFMLFSRLVPGVPSPVANILPALFHVPFKKYLITTMVGTFPVTVIFVTLGRALGQATALSDLITAPVLLTLGALGALAISPVFLRKFKKLPPNLPDISQ